MWQWPRSFVEVGVERMHELGALTADAAARIRSAMVKAEADPATLMITPAVLEIVAAHKRRAVPRL